jgi:hypothetical protein
MAVFETLKAVRAFEREQLAFVETLVDFDLLVAIGYHQETGKPLTLKRLFSLNLCSVATCQRRLARLRKLGVIQQQQCKNDKRAYQLLLSPALLRTFEGYAEWLGRGRRR